MEDVRKSRLFKNLSRKDKIKLATLSARLRELTSEIESLRKLLEQLEELRQTHRKNASAEGIDATSLQTDRWYLTRIEQEAEMVQNRYDFKLAEVEPLKAKILKVSYHKKRTDEMADQLKLTVRNKRFDKELAALPGRSVTKR